ncbi:MULTISPECIES: lysoplasmalogenase family protein [unclassified Knoellia]|uniref:lysoplasmalogenase family protein n=1 Tax=Knoellia altitudinis TaxID=3404795 RepID=UPI003616003D
MSTAAPVPATTPDTPLGERLVPGAAGALAAYAVVVVVHLVAHLADAEAVANATQWFAVPWLLLALVVQTGLRSRLSRFAAGGLMWSWLGDTAPDLVPESVAFIVLMASFLVAHVLFVAGFWPWRRESLLRSRWAWGYGALAVVMVVVCAPRAGALTLGIAGYAAALALMASLSAGVHRLAGVGGALFLVSDGLIAVDEFVPSVAVPLPGFWVMATYLSAVLLLTLGVVRRLGSRA